MTLADHVAERVAQWPRRRITIDELAAVIIHCQPELATAPDRRVREAEIVQELARRGAVTLPATRAWDRSSEPPLPRSLITVRDAQPARQRGRALKIPWRSELSWAAALTLTADQTEILRAVNIWLRDVDPSEPVVPLRERSLEIFGDEKRLDGLVRSQLFAPDRLTTKLLRCRQVHPPFVFGLVGDHPNVLVIENHDTYYSFRSAVGPDDGFGALIYGAGRHFESSVSYLHELPFEAQRIWYFGDLDAAGLAIPAQASLRAREIGLPPIKPAHWLYSMLFEHGTPAPTTPVSEHMARRRAEWMYSDQRDAAIGLLRDGRRLAQEAVGTRLLTAHPLLVRPPTIPFDG